MRGEDGGGAVGAAGQRLHAVVRSAGDDAGAADAGAGGQPDRGRARHAAVADRPPLRGRGAGASRPVRSAPGGHRRDGQPAGSPLHQRVRGSGPGESGACGARQGWGHGGELRRGSDRPWRSGVPSGGSLHRHVAGLSGGGAGASARGPDHLRQISRDPAAQPGGGPGPAGGAGPAGGTEADALPVVEKPAAPDRWATGPAGRPGGPTVEPENGAGVAAPGKFPGLLRPAARMGRRVPEAVVFLGHPQPAGAAH